MFKSALLVAGACLAVACGRVETADITELRTRCFANPKQDELCFRSDGVGTFRTAGSLHGAALSWKLSGNYYEVTMDRKICKLSNAVADTLLLERADCGMAGGPYKVKP